jgi:hypothetical protein
MESALREKLLREGKSPEEIEEAVRQLRAGEVRMPDHKGRSRYEYRSKTQFLGLPLVHIVIGRDPKTGRVGKAVGIVALGRMAFGVLPIGQLAIGVCPIGQLSIGLVFALGQAAFAGYDVLGQLAVSSHFALGQFAAAASAIGQLAVGRYVVAQIGWGRYVWSTKVKDPEALEHFREMFQWLFDLVG